MMSLSLKEKSHPWVCNLTSADVRSATTLSRARHWLTSRVPSVNRTDWSAEIIQPTNETAPLTYILAEFHRN